MIDIPVRLKATNSGGTQTLSFTRDDDEYWVTLHGKYKDQFIQIDFDTMDRGQLEDIHTAIGLLLE